MASVFIIVVSVILFLYWFRYTCLLILNTRARKDYSGLIAALNQLSFLEAKDLLNENGEPPQLALDSLQRSLDREYKLLVYLLRHGTPTADGQSFEHGMLRLDFQMMRIWYAVVHRLSPQQARNALLEMASILGHFANAMGERSALAARSH